MRSIPWSPLLKPESNFTFCIWTQPCNLLHPVFRSVAESCNHPNTSHRPIPNCPTFAHRCRRTLRTNISTPTAARRASTRRSFGAKPVRTISIFMPRRSHRWARRLTSRATRWERASFVRPQRKDRRPTSHNRPSTITRDFAVISRRCHPTMTTTWIRWRIRRRLLDEVPSTSFGTNRNRRRRSRRSKSNSIRLQRTVVRRRRSYTIGASISLLKRRMAFWMTTTRSVRTRKAWRTQFSGDRRRHNCTAFTTMEMHATRWPPRGAAAISFSSNGRRWINIIDCHSQRLLIAASDYNCAKLAFW